MKKILLILIISFTANTLFTQAKQTIAYIDMDYILENIPEYLDAQNTLDGKIVKWRSKLDKQARYIEVLKTDLANEKAILTKDLIEEKEEEISLKQLELRRLESLYFGPNGDLFQVRKQLVKPIQDQVYNAIQNIAKKKKYDFVFDRTSDLVMLYSNKKYDISELILSTINKTRLLDERNKKKIVLQKAKKNIGLKEGLTDKEKNILKRKEDIKQKKQVQQEEKIKLIEERRRKILEQREKKRKLLRQKIEDAKKKKEELKKSKENKE